MSSRSVSVTLSANVGGFVNAMRTAAGAVDQVGSKMKSGMAGMAQSATQNREAWDTVGSTLTRVGAVAAVGVGVAVKAFADFDQAMSNVAATGDDARSNLDALRETAIQVGADTAFSAREAAGGMEELLKAGVSAQDVMGGGLKGALDLAAAGTIGVGEAAEIAATAMTQFGLSGADVPHIADLLAAGAGKAQGSVKDMGQALQQSGLVASQFGLSIEETVGTLSAFASAGLIGSDAGTSFKTMLLALANPSKESAGLMKELGINAYDAAGNFVGISDLAGQLQTKLGGLTQAQRDQALAQIFGNDAVRAANVLMDQGAAGIDSWINKVNDAGYAAETAAQKQNNLRGDLEKLTGSFESLFLQSGTGANDFLRNIVQGAEGAVDALGRLPAPIQQGALAMTGLVAAVGLGGGAFLKALPAIMEFRSATATLAKDMPRTAAAMSTIGKAAGGLTVGIAAIAAGMAIYTQSLETATVTSGTLANAVTAMNSSVGTAGGGVEKLNEQFSQLGRSSITGLNLSFVTGELEGLGNAMQRASNPEFGNGVTRFFNELGLGTSVTVEAQNAFRDLDSVLVQMNPGEAAKGFAQISAEAEKWGITTEQLLKLFPQYADQIRAWANDNNYAFEEGAAGAQQLIDMMGGKLPPALAAAGAAAGITAGEIDGMAKTLSSVPPNTQVVVSGEGILPTTTTVAGLRDAIKDVPDDKYIRVQMPDGRIVEGDAKKVRAALDAMAEEKNIRVATPGMADVLVGLTTLKTNLADVPDDKQISVSVDGGAVAGIQMRDLADHIADVPDDKPITVTIPGLGEVTLKAGQLKQGLAEIPDNKDVKATVDTSAATPRAKELDAQLQAIPTDKKTTIRGVGIDETAKGAGELRAELDRIDPNMEITVWLPNGEAVKGTAGEIKESLDRLEDKDVQVRLNAETGELDAFKQALTSLPPTQQVTINAPGLPDTKVGLEQLRATVEGMPDQKPISVTLPNGEERIFTAQQLRDMLNQLTDKNVNINSNADAEKAKVEGLAQSLAALPPTGQVTFSAPGLPETQGGVNALKSAIEGMDPNKEISITMPNGQVAVYTVQEIRDALAQLADKNVNINADASGAIGAAGQATGAVQGVPNVDRNINANPGGAVSGANTATGAVTGVPNVDRNITANPGGAVSGANTATGAVNAVPNVSRNITVSSNASAVSAAAQFAMNAVQSVTRFINIITNRQAADGGLITDVGSTATAAHVGAQRFIAGGRVAGVSPHPRADNIPAWLTAGEIVQSNKAGDTYGRHRLLALNAGRVDPGEFAAFMRAQGFAGGGQVRDAFSRPAMVTAARTPATVPAVQAPPSRVINQEFHYHYPVAERESTVTRRSAAEATTGAMF